jgi:hypothetical protein
VSSPFALEHADLLGQRIALALQFLGACLDRLAFGFERVESATSSWNLRLARRAATVSMSLRRSWMSIMGIAADVKPQLYQDDAHSLQFHALRRGALPGRSRHIGSAFFGRSQALGSDRHDRHVHVRMDEQRTVRGHDQRLGFAGGEGGAHANCGNGEEDGFHVFHCVHDGLREVVSEVVSGIGFTDVFLLLAFAGDARCPAMFGLYLKAFRSSIVVR